MAQQQQHRDNQFQNLSRTDDRGSESDIQKNDAFQSGIATEPVAAYPVTAYAYEATGVAPAAGGVPGTTTTTTRYEYTAVYGTPAPGFDGANAGGGQGGQEANMGGGAGGNTGMNMNRSGNQQK